MSSLYPFKFKTIYKDKIWGGQKIKTVLGKNFAPLPNCGETWELSGVPGNISEVSNGPLAGSTLNDLIEKHPEQLLGQRVFKKYGAEFPLLVKFIDAADDLSIQVHPDDTLARERHGSFGKTEMWYIMQADEGATLISGFNQELDKASYKKAFDEGRLEEILNREVASAGDVFFLPAGRVHTIGKGLLLAEVQQTSDVTYRIYDFDRTDAQGNKRELHVKDSLDAIDYQKYDSYKTSYKRLDNGRAEVVKCPYFATNKLNLSSDFSVDYTQQDSFVIYVCLSGECQIQFEGGTESLGMGEVALVPAALGSYTILTTGVELLESYIPS